MEAAEDRGHLDPRWYVTGHNTLNGMAAAACDQAACTMQIMSGTRL